jgi:hypothetical protein
VEGRPGGGVVSTYAPGRSPADTRWDRARRLPLAPLLDLLAKRGTRTSANVAGAGHSGATWSRWLHDGVPIGAADRLAVQHGYHPAEVWGSAFYDDEAMAVISRPQDGP